MNFCDFKISTALIYQPQRKTRHTISKAELEKMKDDVVIVNTARGSLPDEAALVEALQTGKVTSVGLIVFVNEPIIHPGLLHNNRVMILHHWDDHT